MVDGTAKATQIGPSPISPKLFCTQNCSQFGYFSNIHWLKYGYVFVEN